MFNSTGISNNTHIPCILVKQLGKKSQKHGSRVYNLFSLESPKTVLVTTEEPPFLETKFTKSSSSEKVLPETNKKHYEDAFAQHMFLLFAVLQIVILCKVNRW
jgi:hypothetical protein